MSVQSVCPTGCDEDCEILCHEWHQVTRYQDHNPTICEVRSHLTYLLRAASADVDAKDEIARRAFSPDSAIDDLRRARAYRSGIERCVEELGNVAG